jgi:hypothetical protein
LDNAYKERETAMDKLFASYNNFIRELASIFSEVDEKYSIERELRMLK